MTYNRIAGANILLVEDDPDVATTLIETLESNGCHVRHAKSGAETGAMLAEQEPDLIILDLMLPDTDGLILCADLKARSDVPVIICSALDQPRERLLSFKLGADDFIAKPFDIAELEARVEAVLRRTAVAAPASRAQAPAPAMIDQIGALAIDRTRRRVTVGGAELLLTPTEYRLLGALVSHAGDVLSREELAQMAWGYQDASIGRSIDAHIRRLRVKLASAPVEAPPIVSVRGFGYKIVKEEPAALAQVA